MPGIGAPLVAVTSFEELGHKEVRKKIDLRLGLEPGTASFEQYQSEGSHLH